MYALYLEHSNGITEFVTVLDTEAAAMAAAVALSHETHRVVVGVHNDQDGTTTICCRFKDGMKISGVEAAPRPQTAASCCGTRAAST